MNRAGEMTMIPAQPSFWEAVLRPIRSETAVTPAIALVKIISPLSVIAAAFAPSPVNSYLFLLASAPVAVAIFLIMFFAVTGKIDQLSSEPHRQALLEMAHRFGSNDGESPREMKLATSRSTANPSLEQAPSPPALESGK